MSEQSNSTTTLPHPTGAEIYSEIKTPKGSAVVLTYNDLWMMIVCQTTLDGDWTRTRQATMMVVDPMKKRAIADRLWRLDQQLEGLPAVPTDVLKLHLHRAHLWFNERMVSDGKTG